MVQSMKDNGKRISSTDKVSRHGLTEHRTREVTLMVKSMEKDISFGLAKVNTQVSSLTIT